MAKKFSFETTDVYFGINPCSHVIIVHHGKPGDNMNKVIFQAKKALGFDFTQDMDLCSEKGNVFTEYRAEYSIMCE